MGQHKYWTSQAADTDWRVPHVGGHNGRTKGKHKDSNHGQEQALRTRSMEKSQRNSGEDGGIPEQL